MSPAAPACLAAALLLLCWDRADGCSNVTSLSQQLDLLLAEYDRDHAPAQPVLLRLVFSLRHASLRPDATVHVLGDLTLTWSDPRITWNASEWGCDTVMASSDRLWQPDVTLLNSAGGGEEAATSALISSAGRVSWVLRFDAAVPINLELDNWPRDQHTAVFKFGSRTLSEDQLVLDIGEKKQSVVFESGAWELMSVSGSLAAAEGAREVSVWRLQLRRRAGAHAAAAGALLAATLLMLAAAAALPPRARPPLCACASFTAALWLVSALPRLPGGDDTPRIFALMCAACVLGALAAAAAALVSRLARCGAAPPRLLRTLASQLSRHCNLAPNEETRESAAVGAWAALAHLLDLVLSGALLLTLALLAGLWLF